MTEPTIIKVNHDLDYGMLDKLLDRVKTKVFLGSNAAFLGPLMCSLNFNWSSDIKTAQTNGISLDWNPYWFLSLPEPTRLSVLLHELWHVALLHMVRRGTREPREWNWACDVAINNMLIREGYTFDGTHPWMDDSINRWKHPDGASIGDFNEASAEEIYDQLIAMPSLSIGGTFIWGHEDEDGQGDEGDMVEPEGTEGEIAGQEAEIVNKVIQASHAAKLAGIGGTPSNVETMLKRFLQPKLPWETLIYMWMSDLMEQDWTWRRPNRRHSEIYLPSLEDDEGRLEHLVYYLDVSGSVSDKEVVRFNSEVKYIKDTFQPRRLTLVLFDDRIQREYVFLEDDPFEEVVIVGRGGTDLEPVRRHMMEASPQPTAAIVFSDMCCTPMTVLPPEKTIPILWVGVNASKAHVVNMGKIIHIKE